MTHAHASVRPLAPSDRARFGMDSADNPMVVTAVLQLDRELDADAWLALVRTRLFIHDRMRARIAAPEGFLHHAPRWEIDETPDAEAYVGRVELGPTANVDLSLASLASDLMREPFDPARATWRSWLVTQDHGAAIVFRIHHAVADGRALLRLLSELSDEGAAASAPRDGAPRRRRRRHVRASLPASWARAFARLVATRPDPPTSLSGPLSGEKRIAWTGPIDVELLRRAGRTVDAHVNDVLLGALAGVLRETVGTEPVHALVPVALVGAGDDAGNHFVSVFVSLPVDVASPRDRVSAAREAMRAARAASGVGVGRAFIAGAALLGPRVERLAVRTMSRQASLVATDLAGPPTELHLAGRRITGVTFAAPAPGRIGLSVSALSYAGKLRLTVAADTGVVARADRLAHLTDEHVRATMMALLAGAP